MSQYCAFLLAGGVTRYFNFREPRVETSEDDGEARSIGGKEFQLTPGTTISHSTFLAGDLVDMGDCSTGVIEMATSGQKQGGTGDVRDRDILNQSTH